MKPLALVAAIMLAQAGSAFAAQTRDTEFDVIAVIPRSPDVQPYFLDVPAEGGQRAAPKPQLESSGRQSKSTHARLGTRQQKASTKDVKPTAERPTDAEE